MTDQAAQNKYEYKTVTSHPATIDKIINGLLDQGWELHGAPQTYQAGSNAAMPKMMQAMIRLKPQTEGG